MNIKIGSDELILWFRKNFPNRNVANDDLGKKILRIIENFGGSKIEVDVPSIWQFTTDSRNVNKWMLPKTLAQYFISDESIMNIYRKLSEIE